jgi:hypothetical protein
MGTKSLLRLKNPSYGSKELGTLNNIEMDMGSELRKALTKTPLHPKRIHSHKLGVTNPSHALQFAIEVTLK